MRPGAYGAGTFLATLLVCCVPALAEDLRQPLSDPPTGREQFLAAAILAMMVTGLVSFLLFGRASERTHVALAMLGMLIGAFALLVLFGGALYQNPLGAAVILLLLIALFKLMSQFESGRRGPTKKN